MGQNLFSSDWTQGNLYQISGVTNFLGNFACIVISVVGFSIVISSILKNVMSGLYCVNPNIWDRVDEVKNQAVGGINDAIGKAANGNQAVKKLGGVFTFLLSLIPNVKALTDFDEDAIIDKKQYFTKSLIMCIAQIFIGMFIFFGYPSKIAAWIGSAGTEAVDIVLNNVNPIEVVGNLSTKLVNVEFATDGSADNYDIVINQMAKEAYNKVIGKLSDTEKGPRQTVAYELETWLMGKFATQTQVLSASDGYDFSTSATYLTQAPTVDGTGYVAVSGSNDMFQSTANDGTITYRTWLPTSSLSSGSTKVGSTDYLRIDLKCTPRALSATDTTTGSAYLSAGGQMTVQGQNTFMVLSGLEFNSSKVTGKISGTPGSDVTVTVYSTYSISALESNVQLGSFQATLDVTGSSFQLKTSVANKDLMAKIANGSKAVIAINGTNRFTYTSGGGTATADLPITSFGLNMGSTGILLSNSTIIHSDPQSVYNAIKNVNSGAGTTK